MLAALDDPACLQHHNAIAWAHGAQPVGITGGAFGGDQLSRERGSPPRFFVSNRRGGLIEDQHGEFSFKMAPGQAMVAVCPHREAFGRASPTPVS